MNVTLNCKTKLLKRGFELLKMFKCLKYLTFKKKIIHYFHSIFNKIEREKILLLL